uniref:Uncharacterized protein n=1 Tax=viral metagenome TaxID=1070528 RepID=A0A6M3IS40_9ZZZZ
MKAVKFDEIVKARANKRVQDKVVQFKRDITAALGKLTGGNYIGYATFGQKYWEHLAKNGWATGWPPELWENEEKKVENELLAIMDEMQKALLDADRNDPGEFSPGE